MPHEIEDVTVEHETDKAILCIIEGKKVWIPKYAIDEDSEVYEMGTEGTLIVSDKFAEKEGLS